MRRKKTIEIDDEIVNVLKNMCSKIEKKVKVKMNYNKLLFLIIAIYLITPDKFIKKFSDFASNYKHLLYKRTNGNPFVLKKDKVLKIIKEQGKTVNSVSLQAWGNTCLYHYLWYNKKHRLNFNKAKKLADVLGVDIDDITYKIDYLDMKIFREGLDD